MNIFEKSRVEELQFQSFMEKADGVYRLLTPYDRYIDITEIESIKKNFLIKTEDFYREDRKLNIGVVGRVKAGKSSFLNTFLFGGKELLPKAVVPKTAVLTKIEYATENSFQVEYLPYAVNRGIEHKEFSSYEEMEGELHDYIGENGAYTEFVKSVVIYTNHEEMMGISVVDTPGFCDPDPDRIKKTRDFLEVCDVVFFLSRATGFLDKGDVELLASQLPLKGVKRLVLVCSRIDDGLRDMIWSAKSLVKAEERMKHRLTVHAHNMFADYWENTVAPRTDVKDQGNMPIFISSMAHNMTEKSLGEYTPQEKKMYEDLNQFGELTSEYLKRLGNFQEIQDVFKEIIEEKESTLEEKALSFYPLAKEELRGKLLHYDNLMESKIEYLRTVEKGKLEERRKVLSAQINGLNGDLEKIFSELFRKIQQNKSDILQELMGHNRECSQILEREGTETHYQLNNVATAKWFMPWTWGQITRQVNSYDEKYTYIDIGDVLENIRSFSEKAKKEMEDSLGNIIDMAVLKNQLLQTVLDNFDASDVNFDTPYFKLIVERSLAQIEMPVLNYNINNAISTITLSFKGEIRSLAKMNELKGELARVSSDMFHNMGEKYEKIADEFKARLERIKAQFSVELLENMNAEVSVLRIQMEEKDKEIDRYLQLLQVLRRITIE